MNSKENTISILVNNKPDVLARIAGTFSGKSFNIESISANVTMNPEVTKIVITTLGDQETVVKLEKQLYKIVDVLEIKDLTGVASVQQEMILIRMKMADLHKDLLMQTIDTHKWKIVSKATDYCILEVTGSKNEVERILNLLEPMGMDDFTRTGTIAIERCKPLISESFICSTSFPCKQESRRLPRGGREL
jgi:acetolactate synthase-1/3 small subunit